jgi:hypothetical protein
VGRGEAVGRGEGGGGTGVRWGGEVGRVRGVERGCGVGAPDCEQYRPPVFKSCWPLNPPQTIISFPVQTAVCENRGVGASVVLVAVQLSLPRLYLPPVFNPRPLYPPQTIICFPVQIAV